MVHVSYLILAFEEYEQLFVCGGVSKNKEFFRHILSISCEFIDKQANSFINYYSQGIIK